MFDCLCACFPAIGREVWRDRFARGRVLDAAGAALDLHAAFQIGMEIRYFREVMDEPEIPFAESVLFADEHLVVADKPHFLPVVPAGRFVRETLLGRLVRRLGNADLAPLHRIDRDTAGLVVFSAHPGTRAAYQDLFRLRRIDKRYEALAPGLPELAFPLTHRSRLVSGEPFFRMREGEGEPNSETRIEVLERGDQTWCYGLAAVTGRKHQLRVHLLAIGHPILGDALYAPPAIATAAPRLMLHACGLRLSHPLTGAAMEFSSPAPF